MSNVKAPVGYVLAPLEPTEEMIQAACLNQCTVKYSSYYEWRNNHSSGISERIRDMVISDYRVMIAEALGRKE
jgi:hypothetical protein